MTGATLYELGDAYQSAADALRAMIARRRERLRDLGTAGDQKKIYALECELRVLYLQCRDTQATADYLRHYYDPQYHGKGFYSV
ncbi:MAG: hypothetical protein IJK64_03740 [Clostridia bacterium]|nr:hypothetical protein [Clostridia bacterium]